MTERSLDGEWSLRRVGAEDEGVAAQVPGCVHDALRAAGRIPDPFDGENEHLIQWVGEADWIFERAFDVSADDLRRAHAVLRCEGLDTFAKVELNGRIVARVDNMFREWEWDVRAFLQEGRNTLRITFSSVLPHVRERQAARPLFSWNGAGGVAVPGTAYVRKEACNFGWDWAPIMVTCGIWRPVCLLFWDGARLRDVRVGQVHETSAVQVTVDVASEGEGVAVIRLTRAGRAVAEAEVPVADGKAWVTLTVPDPELWWPNGLGAQPLYDVAVALMVDGATVDTWERRVGLRRIVLDRHPDAWGESFQFLVNDVPVFAKGANWIPIDPYPSSASPERQDDLLRAAAAVHMNMIRAWGGGVYPDDRFFDLCDELGLLVWQDFMFACSLYPSDEPAFLENIAAEAADQIRRIRHHACLALWCGNNELEQGLVADEWSAKTMSWQDYGRLFDDLLPRMVAERDGTTAYWPCSPHSPRERRNFNSPREGDCHLWDVWFTDAPFESYRQSEHRFNSEFGFQSFPALPTVKSFAPPEEWNIGGPVFEHHQRSSPGNARIFQKILEWFRAPKDFVSTLALSQIVQALAIQIGVEHWRRSRPRCMGTLYWQLNDCWPVASWASIDWFDRWKALHYAARRFFAPVLLSGVEDREQGRVSVYVVNDGVETVTLTVRWILATVDGRELDRGEISAVAPALASTAVGTVDCAAALELYGSRAVVVWLEAVGGGAFDSVVLFDRPRRMALPDPALELRRDGETLIVTAQAPALWVWLETDDGREVFSDNYFSLRPGVEKRITGTHPDGRSLDAWFPEVRVRSLRETF